MTNYIASRFAFLLMISAAGIAPAQQANRPAFRAAEGLFDASNTKTLGLDSVPGTDVMLYRATEDGHKFCHHPNLAVYRNQLFCMWSNGLVDEDAAGQRVLYSRTRDGRRWTKPKVLTDHRRGKGICVAAGFRVVEDRLIAFYTATGGENFHPDTALLARVSGDGDNWTSPQRVTSGFFIEGPRQLPSGRLLLGGEFVGKDRASQRMRLLYSDKADGLSGWRTARIKPADSSVFGYTEPSFFFRKNQTVIATLRNNSGFLYASASSDDGRTWSVPVKSNFPDSTARTSAGNLPSGVAYIINNPMPQRLDRSLLTMALSRDGRTFDRAFLIRGEPTKKRFDGKHKLDGWQYPHALVWKENLYVAYSINKEDVGIKSIALRELE